MFTIRRNKYGRLMYATAVANNHITHLATDPAAAVQLDEPTARAVVDAHKARNNPAAGRIEAVDAKGKVIAAAGEPGEEPKPVVPPVSLPGLAERVRVVEERVEMIEASDATAAGAGGIAVNPLTAEERKEIEALLAKAKASNWLALPPGTTSPFTADEAAALKGMLAEWAAHKQAAAAKEKNERKDQQAGGSAGEKAGGEKKAAANAPAG